MTAFPFLIRFLQDSIVSNVCEHSNKWHVILKMAVVKINDIHNGISDSTINLPNIFLKMHLSDKYLLSACHTLLIALDAEHIPGRGTK